MAGKPLVLVEARIDGLAELDAIFAALPTAFTDRVIDDGLTLALRPMEQTAKALAPVTPDGKVRASITVEPWQFGNQRSYAARTVVLRAKSRLAHLFEYGTAPRFTQEGKPTGQMVAKPFMRPAYQQHKGEIFGDLSKYFWEALTRKMKSAQRGISKGKIIKGF
jgi:hypothetical protein